MAEWERVGGGNIQYGVYRKKPDDASGCAAIIMFVLLVAMIGSCSGGCSRNTAQPAPTAASVSSKTQQMLGSENADRPPTISHQREFRTHNGGYIMFEYRLERRSN